ncbi:MFS transporter [Variovorax ureilyticus]|uniref:MFS transporter n=1 Tax=Variovorax ureilyticus TaxID=1836198 RepID=A0ABU8VB88_9BURK
MSWKSNPRAVLIALLVIHILAHIDRNMVLGFSPQITRDLALSNAQYGFLTGAVWVLSFGVMALFMGTLADRFSRTRVMAAGILVWSACTAASGMAHSFEQMALARFFVASGEAALVPAAVSLLAELFSAERRGGAMGVFFMGIPLGIGLSFLLAGSFESQGWRSTFTALGVAGVMVALPLVLLRDHRGTKDEAPRGAPFRQQVRNVFAVLRSSRTIQAAIAGFVLAHMAFVGLAFMQLWLVRERGFDPGQIARQIGGLQILFGVLGSLVGGVLGDRFARRMAGGHAGFMATLVVLCAPLMIASRFVPAGSPLLYVGLCASFFLPLALYGPALAVIQGHTPAQMRSTVTGVTMLLINVVAIAIGNLAAGAVSDRLAAGGSTSPLTTVLLATDVFSVIAGVFFILAARGPKVMGAQTPIAAH